MNTRIDLTALILCAGLASAAEAPQAPPVPNRALQADAKERPAPPPPKEKNGYLELGFEHLGSYKYDLPLWDGQGKPPKPKGGQIPADVLAWSGREAAVKGFVFPLEGDEKGWTSFVLIRHLATCCFGANVQPTDFIVVTMPKGKPLFGKDGRPVLVYGKLEVGEEFEDGFLISLYRMKAERVEDAS